eukprot:TRINITY_DN11313_c0_g1_i1.p1 TRINITY_DN11313_c0_g1~~TRINITY_DN11313_c0_g1_i1.p1  ORF type:complete len:289 (-),score=42.51 TRINITY_DN11313_c0_g1_i1:206-1072(-)
MGTESDLADICTEVGQATSCNVQAAQLTESCGICFEPLEGSVLELPCACKVSFCTTCGDRSLCESFKTCGEARCPTCRLPVQVDFDAEKNSLVFSRQAQDVEVQEGSMSALWARGTRANHTREKIIEQVRPAQIRNLQTFGAKQAVLGTEGPASGPQPAPKCVCGGSFFKQSVLDRARSYMRRSIPQDHHVLQRPLMFETFVRQNLDAGRVTFTCDMCSNVLETDGVVWTCENDDRTILHSTTYDICGDCFDRVTSGRDVVLPEPKGPPISYGPGDSAKFSDTDPMDM